MYKKLMFGMFGALLAISSTANAGLSAVCGDQPRPLLSVADFNGDGIVTGADLKALTVHSKKRSGYYALYDRNADGILNQLDVRMAAADMGKRSSQLDQKLAYWYNRFSRFQHMQGVDAFASAGYFAVPPSLQGHGLHWFNNEGMGTMLGMKPPLQNIAEGLNIDTENNLVHAVFWGFAGTPVYDPACAGSNGENWKDCPVIAFSNTPPSFTGSHTEKWHAHAGLCMTASFKYDADDNQVFDINGRPVFTDGVAEQYMSYNECQVRASDMKMPDGSNMWANFYMLHVWMFDLNPAGVFAGKHPCVETDGVSDEALTGDREAPEFFANMH